MPHSPTGPCAVCGVRTSQRCGSCADFGVDVFLCGREHQKLVWFAHKKVCGFKPFRFPPLAHEEVGKAIENLHGDTFLGPSMSAMLSLVHNIGPSEVPGMLASLVHPPDLEQDSTLASRSCAFARGLLYAVAEQKRLAKRAAMVDPDCPPECHQPLYIASYVVIAGSLSHTVHGSVNLDVFEERNDHYSSFHHFIVIYAALYSVMMARRRADNPSSIVCMHFCQQTLQQLQKSAAAAGADTPHGEHMIGAARCLPRTILGAMQVSG